jgi:multisubunit Na+/H+ antiporter MnhG subunit
MDGVIMTPGMKIGIAGIVIGLILVIIGVPAWAIALVFVIALAIPVGGYLMLDKSQRRRLRGIRRRQVDR